MEGLMHICKYWGTENCYPDISNVKYAKEIEPGEDIPLWPVGDELRRLDEVCKKCDSRLFGIEKKECPVCGTKDIKWKGTKEIEYELGFIKGNFYRCNECNTELISGKK